MPIRGDPVGRDAGDHLGRLEERLRGGHITVLAEHHVDQRAGAINGAVEITPLSVDLDVGLIDVTSSGLPCRVGVAVGFQPMPA